MGWVLNPEDWWLYPSEIPHAGVSDPIVMSNVRCGPLDTDITRCKLSEKRDMFLNSCSHSDDVGLRCYDVSWSGIRLGMTAKRSKLYDVKVERAGLLDYRTFEFKPAIQVWIVKSCLESSCLAFFVKEKAIYGYVLAHLA